MNHAALTKYLNNLYDLGARTVMTTAGTSRFNLLAEEEIHNFNKTVNKFKGERIIGVPPLANRHLDKFLFQFLQYLDDGRPGGQLPSALMLLYPDRYYCDKDIVDYFYRAASILEDSNIPVMFHGMFMRNARGGMYQYTSQLCEEIKSHDNIVGMKEESLDLNRAYDISKLADDDFVVIPAGGSCRRFILCQAAGAQTFLAGIGNYMPAIEESFFRYCKEGNINAAHEVVRVFEDPFMEAAKTMGWHKFLQGLLTCTNMLPSVNRKPFSEITPEEIILISEIIALIDAKLGNPGNLICQPDPGS
jgi:dihydrodipicolinate synthase/N-acetylneuraminate lyase